MVPAASSRTIFAHHAGHLIGRYRTYLHPSQARPWPRIRQWQCRGFLAPPVPTVGPKQRRETTADPISVEEFQVAFQEALGLHSVRASDGAAQLLGIAVSGGVDSIALVTLCQALAEARPRGQLRFKAYIVDHAARAESAREALQVAGYLQQWGVPCTIATIEWPHGVAPLGLTSFETVAREARFRALARACLRDGVTSMLMAHHGDDQAETVLGRLAHGHDVPGLGGLRPSSGIPESFGLYGVYRSGTPLPALTGWPMPRRGTTDELSPPRLDIESGGVQVVRPLLAFHKERLIATCLNHGRVWFEDPTNADVTVTPRNAIRTLLQRDRLPQALRVPSLLALSRRVHHRRKVMADRREEMLNLCGLQLDSRVGAVRLRLPEHADARLWSALVEPRPDDRCVVRRASLAEEFVVRVMGMVLPEGQRLTTRSRLAELLEDLMPGVGNKFDESTGKRRVRNTRRITLGSVMFQRRGERPAAEVREAVTELGLDTEHIWMVCRQPTQDVYMPHSPVLFPSPYGPNADPSEPRNCWSSWRLWDGRFWIRVLIQSPHDIVARCFTKDDDAFFRGTLPAARYGSLKRFLAATQLNGLSWTLPALSLPNGPALVLPSIGFWYQAPHANDMLLLPGRERGQFKWQIRYKNVEPI